MALTKAVAAVLLLIMTSCVMSCTGARMLRGDAPRAGVKPSAVEARGLLMGGRGPQRALHQVPQCSASADGGSAYLGSFMDSVADNLIDMATDEIPVVGFIFDALLEAIIPGSSNQDSNECLWQNVEAYVQSYVQQALATNDVQDLYSTLSGLQDLAATMQPLNWQNNEKANIFTQLRNTMVLDAPNFVATTQEFPSQGLPILVPFYSLQLATQAFFYNNYTLFYKADQQNQAVALSNLQSMITAAQGNITQAIATALQQRASSVNPNWPSKSCDCWAGQCMCGWSMIDGWNGFTYTQQNVLNIPSSLPYLTPGQYPAEYSSMVTTTLNAQLQALTAVTALFPVYDPTTKYTVTNTVSNAKGPLVGMWSSQTVASLPTVQNQIASNPNALIYTPSGVSITAQNALQSIVVYSTTTSFENTVVGVSFLWQLPSGPQSQLIGVTGPIQQTLTLQPNEYVVTVQGVTAGLDGGVQYINFTTNLGNTVIGGSSFTPFPDTVSNIQTSVPMSAFFHDFSGQPSTSPVWMCGAYGFNQADSALSSFPSGVCCNLDKENMTWRALSTIGFNWCWNSYDVAKA